MSLRSAFRVNARSALLGALLLVAGCAASADTPAPAVPSRILLAAAGESEVPVDGRSNSGSPFGAYLAGLFASNHNDLSAAADFMTHALVYDPENTQLLTRSLMLLAGSGRYEQAVETARKLSAQDPANGIALLVLAVDAVERSALDEAREIIERLPDRGLSSVTQPLLRAWLETERGDGDAALQAAMPLKNKSGFGLFYYLHVGLMQVVLGQNAEAKASFEEAVELAGQPSLRMVWLAGNALERIGDRERAIALYRAFLERNPDSSIIGGVLATAEAGKRPESLMPNARAGMAEALFNLAGLLSQERAEEVALVHLHLALALRPDLLVGHILLGEILQSQGRSEEAVATYRTIPRESEFSWMVGLRIAEELERLERTEEAAAEFERLATARPGQYEPLLRLGNLMRAEERYKEAAAAYDRAIARIDTPERRHWTIFYFRGICHERLSQWEQAEKDFLLALELEPEQPFVMNYLAYSWIEQKLHMDKAKAMLARAVELRPDDGYIVDSLGWVYYRLGDYRKGVQYLERAVELRPQDPVINDHLGDAYWRVGRYKEARFQWRRALSLEPEEEEVAKIQAKIRSGLPDEPTDI